MTADIALHGNATVLCHYSRNYNIFLRIILEEHFRNYPICPVHTCAKRAQGNFYFIPADEVFHTVSLKVKLAKNFYRFNLTSFSTSVLSG